MAGRHEALVAERRHHLDLVLRHGAERVARMVVAAGWLLRVPIAAQIGRHHGEFLREPRRKLVPGEVCERVAVHEQHGRPFAAVHRDDARAGGPDLGAGKAFHHEAIRRVGKGALLRLSA